MMTGYCHALLQMARNIVFLDILSTTPAGLLLLQNQYSIQVLKEIKESK